MPKKKGLVGELVCDIEVPILKYQIDIKEDEILRGKTYMKFWKRGLRRKGFGRHLRAGLRKDIREFRKELKGDRQDLAKLRSKLRKCM